MTTIYPYNIGTSFHGVVPNLNKLTLEIGSAISSRQLTAISNDETDVSLTFDGALSGAELTILDNLVDVHTPDIPFPYSKVTSSVTTNTTDNYQVANTLYIYAFESDKYKMEIEYQISSTLTGMDVQIVMDGNPIYSNNQTLSSSILGTRINIFTFEMVDVEVGLHKLELQFCRPGALAASTIYSSKLYATNLNLS